MYTPLRSLLTASAFVLVLRAPSAYAEAPAKSAAPAVSVANASAAGRLEELLKLSDNDGLLADMDLTATLEERLGELQQAGLLKGAKLDGVRAVIKQRCSGAALQKAMRERMLTVYDAAKVDELIAYYKTPIGSRYGRAGSDHPSEEQIAAWAEKTPPSNVRLQKVTDLMVAADALKGIELMLMSPAVGTVKAMVAAGLGGGQAPTEADLEAQLRPMLDAIKPELVKTLAYVLRDFSDAELDGFVAFEKGPAARWYHGQLFKAAGATLEDAFLNFGTALRDALLAAQPQAK